MNRIAFRPLLALPILVLLAGLAAPPVLAQEPGGVRAQGRDVTDDDRRREAAPAAGQLADPRDQMRRFIRNISSYIRRFNRDFIIIVQNGLDLLEKVDAVDSTKRSPAGTYIRAIDGVLIEGLYFRPPDATKKDATNKTDEDETAELLRLADLATSRGLRVLVTDYAVDRKNARESYRLNAAKGFASFAAIGPFKILNEIPPFPIRPIDENPQNVTTIKQVRNFLHMVDSSRFGRQEEFARALNNRNFDAVIVDVFHRGREPFNRRSINAMKFKKLGARRLVLAHMNIGQAESYRYFWRETWREGSPNWITSPVPGNPDKYYVKYWDRAWQKLMSGDTQSYIYGIFAQGFDGVVLDGTEAYRFFEGGAR